MQVGVGRVERRFGGDCIRFRGLHRGLIGAPSAVDCTFSSCASNCPFFYVIAFLNVQVGNLSVGVGADVDVSLRLNFTRSAHHRRQVLALDFPVCTVTHVLAALMHVIPTMMANSTTAPAPIAIFFQGFIVSVAARGLASLAFGLMFDPSQVHRLDGHVF